MQATIFIFFSCHILWASHSPPPSSKIIMALILFAANRTGTAKLKIARNLTVLHSMLENIDTEGFVVVQILSSLALHTLIVYEKGFDGLTIRE